MSLISIEIKAVDEGFMYAQYNRQKHIEEKIISKIFKRQLYLLKITFKI